MLNWLKNLLAPKQPLEIREVYIVSTKHKGERAIFRVRLSDGKIESFLISRRACMHHRTSYMELLRWMISDYYFYKEKKKYNIQFK